MPSKTTIPFDLPGLEVDRVDSLGDLLVIRAHSTALEAMCPNCHQSSSRVHSHYTREPRDLPSSGRKVRLVLSVRRFRCQNVDCTRKTVADRRPPRLGWGITLASRSSAVPGEGIKTK